MKDGISWYLMRCRGPRPCDTTAEFFCAKSSQPILCFGGNIWPLKMEPGAAKRSERGERVPWGANSIRHFMDCLKSTLLTFHLVPPAWCGKRVPQDNLKQKRAFVQLERLMQVKFKVREKGWVGEWRLMDDVCEDVTQKSTLPSTTVEDDLFARLQSCGNEFCLIGFILFIVLRNYR